MSDVLKQELLGLLREIHQVRTSLFLDKGLLANKTVAKAISSLNKTSERVQVLYEAVADEEAPDLDLPRDPEEQNVLKLPLIANLESLYNLLREQLAEAGVNVEPDKIKKVQQKRKAKRRKKQSYNNRAGRKPQ